MHITKPARHFVEDIDRVDEIVREYYRKTIELTGLDGPEEPRFEIGFGVTRSSIDATHTSGLLEYVRLPVSRKWDEDILKRIVLHESIHLLRVLNNIGGGTSRRTSVSVEEGVANHFESRVSWSEKRTGFLDLVNGVREAMERPEEVLAQAKLIAGSIRPNGGYEQIDPYFTGSVALSAIMPIGATIETLDFTARVSDYKDAIKEETGLYAAA